MLSSNRTKSVFLMARKVLPTRAAAAGPVFPFEFGDGLIGSKRANMPHSRSIGRRCGMPAIVI